MKKLANLIALFILVSINVLTPISYAQDTQELVENLPEILEDGTPSLINMVVDTVDDFAEELEESGDANEGFVMPSRGEITVAEETLVAKSITHDVEKGIIKLKYGDDEIWIKDKNVGASEIALTGKAFQLKQLMDEMCHFRYMEDQSMSLASIDFDYSQLDCDEGFTTAVNNLLGISITTYASGMEYINEHRNNSISTYGYYYWRGNDGYAKYSELSCKQAFASEGIDDGCELYVDDAAKERGFFKLSNYNEGRYEGGYDNPCDVSEGEYLPSTNDWGALVDMWKYVKGDVSAAVLSDTDFKIDGPYNAYNFVVDLMIPHAGYVSINNPYEETSLDLSANNISLYYANNSDYLRSNRYEAIVMDFSRYYRTVRNVSDASDNANPVRCFVATDPVTYTIKFNNGDPDKVMKIQRGQRISQLETPKKDGAAFSGWILSPVDFDMETDDALTIEADWVECLSGQIVRDNQCIYEVEHDTYKGILKVTDGERMVYIKDRNVGATISAGLDKTNMLYTLPYKYGDLCRWRGGPKDKGQVSSVDEIRNVYSNDSEGFFDEASSIIGYEVSSCDDIEDFIYEYNPWIDTGYNYSFGNFYFWGNNSGAAYTGFVIENSEENGLIISNYYPDLLSIGFSGGNLENSGWVEGYYDNPCDNSKGEYLPTPEDWAEVMDIWYTNNYSNYAYSQPESLEATSTHYSISNRDIPQFQQDLLIPYAGLINKSCYGDVRGAFTSSEDELGCSLQYQNRPDFVLWAGRNKDGCLGSMNYGYLASTRDGNDRSAYPVRCFVYVEPKDVTFVDGDKSWIVKVESGDVVREPEYTQSEGRTFNGWYNGTQEWDFELPVTSNITLTAKYDMITKKVTFNSNGGSSVGPIDVEYGKPISNLPSSIKNGYTLEGWYLDEGLTQKYASQAVTEDITLYAKWTEKSFTGGNGGGYSGGGSSSRSSSQGSGPSSSDVKSVDNPKDNTTDNKKEETKPEVKPVNNGGGKATSTGKVNPQQELFDAYKWAYANGLTKYANMADARLDDPLNRQEMAKISTLFATKFVDKSPNTKKRTACSQYSDLWKVTSDMEEFIIESCELGYMGYRANGVDYLERFRPYTPVSLAEFSIIISRIMWGNTYALNEKQWYQGHLRAVYENNLIDNITKPFEYITRKDAYLMLYRLSKNF